jgi:hypothetical protein
VFLFRSQFFWGETVEESYGNFRSSWVFRYDKRPANLRVAHLLTNGLVRPTGRTNHAQHSQLQRDYVNAQLHRLPVLAKACDR